VDTQSEKVHLVDSILKNSVYMPESGMILRLRAALLKLSRSQLGSLKVLINLKIADATNINRIAEANRKYK
jgi:hypothetical protein